MKKQVKGKKLNRNPNSVKKKQGWNKYFLQGVRRTMPSRIYTGHGISPMEGPTPEAAKQIKQLELLDDAIKIYRM